MREDDEQRSSGEQGYEVGARTQTALSGLKDALLR